MVDAVTHRTVDMIPSRESEDVTAWLKEYPNLKIVSRDGSVSYASAISEAGTHILQVSDRFHLIKGLSDVCKKEIQMLLKANFIIPKQNSHYEGTVPDAGYWEVKTPPDVVETTHEKTGIG